LKASNSHHIIQCTSICSVSLLRLLKIDRRNGKSTQSLIANTDLQIKLVQLISASAMVDFLV
jgi:uncharacterized protein YifN (PemK superfamily)